MLQLPGHVCGVPWQGRLYVPRGQDSGGVGLPQQHGVQPAGRTGSTLTYHTGEVDPIRHVYTCTYMYI